MYVKGKFCVIVLLSALLYALCAQIPASYAESKLPNQDLIDSTARAAPGFFKKFRFAEAPFNGGDFLFKTKDNQELKLSNFEGKTTLIALWASWCPPCRKELPELAALHKKLRQDANFAIIAIHTGGDYKKGKALLTKLKAEDLPFYYTDNMKIFDKIRAHSLAFGMPVILLLDKNQDLIASYNGIAPWASDEAFSFIKHIIAAQR